MTSKGTGRELGSEIERLEQLLNQKKLEKEILERNCKHKWMKTIYDPETVYEFQITHFEGRSFIPRGYEIPVQKPRWSRECECCGKKEYTYERKPIIVDYEPTFGRD